MSEREDNVGNTWFKWLSFPFKVAVNIAFALLFYGVVIFGALGIMSVGLLLRLAANGGDGIPWVWSEACTKCAQCWRELGFNNVTAS